MFISQIVAASENNAIGNKGQLLWHLPNDLKFFKNTTWAMPVVMGRKTFESFGKPLQGRTNIVITTQEGWKAENTITVSSIEAGITAAKKLETREIFIIGGGQIYKESLPLCNRIYITRVHADIPQADAFYPAIPKDEWELVSRKDFEKDEKHAYAYSFETWERNPE